MLLVTHTHLKWCENTKLVSVDASVGSAALPRMKIWVENSVYHTLDHNI